MVLLGSRNADIGEKERFIVGLRNLLAQRSHQDVASISDAQIIATVLLEESSVEDCIVLHRRDQAAHQTFVGYVVVSEPFSPERLTAHLENLLPPAFIPQHYVALSSIPLTVDGQVDEESLVIAEVIDSDLIQRWETTLQSLDNVDQVAVVPQPTMARPSVMHLSDLLPNWKTSLTIEPDLFPGAKPIAEASDVPDAEEVASQIPALAYGGDLPADAHDLQTLPELLIRAAREVAGERIIYLAPDGTESQQSYADLLAEAERILAGLRSLGLTPQDKVIFQLELTQDIIPAFWGCVLGGFIPVIMSLPPNYHDANSGVEKLCNVWKLLDNPLILTGASNLAPAQQLSQWLPADALTIRGIDCLRAHEPNPEYHSCQPHDLAFFNLTSGSTGMPKCIGLTHWNLISRAIGTNVLCHHTADDVILNWLPFDHIGSISDWHVRCLYLGCTLVYTVKEYVLGSPLNWLDLIDRYRITHSWAPNFAYALVNDALKEDAEHSWDLSCVKSLLTAGEAVSSTAVEDFIDNLSGYGFKNTAIRPAFGMAEMGSGITYYQPTEAEAITRHIVDKLSLQGKIKRVSPEHPNCSVFTDLGPVIPGVSIRIVDSQDQVLMEDTIGRLQVKGDAVSPGYYKNPAVNQEVFLEEGWFDTGDLGFLSNGHLVISGRAKETIIINGANYYNHEIEAVVEELDDIDVSYTAACAVRDGVGSTEDLAIFFHVTTTNDTDLTEVIRTVRQTVVAKVGINPTYLIPVERSVIPKTAIGKIQRSQLSKQFEAGEFDPILKQVDLLLANANTLPDWFYQKTWRQKQITTLKPEIAQGHTLIFRDAGTIGTHLQAVLTDSGQTCVIAETSSTFLMLDNNHYQIDPSQSGHYQQLIAAINQTGMPVTQVIHLWSLESSADPLQGHADALDSSLYSLLFLVQALASVQGEDTPVSVLMASTQTQSVLDTDAVIAERATVLGFLKSATQEMSWLDCHHLDLPTDADTDAVRWIRAELVARFTDIEVAYRMGSRWVPRLESVNWSEQPQQPIPFQKGGMYVLSGGLGGVGVEVARYLLSTFEARLLLLGRTPLPERSTWNEVQDAALAQRIAAYQELEALGGQIQYGAVDLGDVAQVKQMVANACAQWQQPLHGVVHLAGVASDHSVLEETRDSLAAVLYPKVTGARSLYQLVANQPGALFITFSSVNGFFGGNRGGAYAAANRFLDAFAHTLHHHSSVDSYCFSWSMWDDVGMSQGYEMKEFSRIQGFYTIPPEQGLQSFIGSLQNGQRHLWIGLDGTRRNVQQYLEAPSVSMQSLTAYVTLRDRKQGLEVESAEMGVYDCFGILSSCTIHHLPEMPLTDIGVIDRPQLLTLGSSTSNDLVNPRTEVEQKLVQIWQDVLGIPRVGVCDSFFELGGTSIQAAKLFAQIDYVLGTNLPLSTLFTAQTIEQLAFLIQDNTEIKEWSPLVAVQPNGNNPPIFCIHGAGGNILMYRELVPYLGEDQPLYGLQAVGLNGGAPITRLGEMAGIYVEHILKAQPKGPYYLLGLSVGGMIAVEIARILQGKGHEVSLLAMIDSLGPGYPKLLPVVPRFFSLLPYALLMGVKRLPALIQKKLNRGKPDIKQATTSLLTDSPISQRNSHLPSGLAPALTTDADQPEASSAQSQKSVSSSLNWPLNQIEAITLNLLRYTPWAFVVPRFYLDSGRSLPQRYQRVQEATVKAFLNYNPEPYSGSAVLFRASQQPPGCYPEPTLGWSKVIEGELKIFDVPGVHGESLLYRPKSLQILGPRIREVLENVQP
ncbi:SDR family NAD(P)-dependent oxidoreductase [Lyngbya confervoides]|uniref:SDR family NAD(P)-dependent oxidoreductase n=1 Tax=Lyngbya confervoides BDU141951 TaxID=1574623 RepID=A0ABD4T8Y7_9CYAN|nr:SDR family NAD(P)-dependent oxidoreductase [Lyngbya confervoides]MCM1984908.1 SDR family NAD(P)-dependent oxidoreductase [Lyngbya confervoides BDU141951]